MSRISVPDIHQASGTTAELFARIKKGAGRVPNLFALIGSLTPVALSTYLQLEGVLSAGSLPKNDIETINIAVSAATGCDYCLAAHSVIGKAAGLAPDAILALRTGRLTGDAKRDALADFARLLVKTSGTVPLDQFKAIKAAGYSDQQLVEISLAVALIIFTNTFNRINDTTLDFPPVK